MFTGRIVLDTSQCFSTYINSYIHNLDELEI